MDRIIDITLEGRHLRRKRGFLLVEEEGTEIGRIALDEIHALIIHAHGTTYSNALLTSLAKQGALTVICDNNHFPVALIKPLHKQLWKQIIIAKIKMQIAMLKAHTQNPARLEYLIKQVRSGDPENIEAQAARFYWPLLFGDTFRRDRNAGGINAMLNYGYTVLRATIARALIASGLNASIGIHHHNQYNAFALVDDLMEPFRPLVDGAVLGLIYSGIKNVCPESKQVLTQLISLDLDCGNTRSPLTTVASRLCFSLSQSFEKKKATLDLPNPPSAIELQALGRSNVEI